MSTRHAKPGGPMRQERFASRFDRGLLANLVAKRCSVLESSEDRAMIWELQWLSWQPGGLSQAPVRGLDIYCLDPDSTLEETDKELVKSWLLERKRRAGRFLFWTEIGKRICEALDYTREARTISIIDGPSRTGKTFAVRAWCEQRPGLVRYAETPCSMDETSFFLRLAKALGVSASLECKAMELRARVEQVLHSGDLMLVLDEAHYCWPAGRIRDTSVPWRINWLNTALSNFGVSVALVTTPQFYTAQQHVEKYTGWNSDQFIGRIGHVERLPRALSRSDLMCVAAALLPPECSGPTFKKLAVYAELSKKHLASIEAIAKRARWIAAQDGRERLTEQDVDRAINESVIPSDSALAVSLQRGVAAELAPSGRRTTADRPPSRLDLVT